MDRRVFMALGILAAAAGSPVFAEQVRVASAKGELLHVNRLTEDDMIMASPAIAGGRLFLRTARGLYCLSRPE